MGNKLKILSLFLLSLLVLSNHKSANEVNSFNLLLPTSYNLAKGHARQIIITSGNCYNWQSTSPNIIRVQGTHRGLVPSQSATKNQNCHSNGIVQLMHQGAYPSSVYITARDRGSSSSQLINIPVRIRDLKRVSIFTKSRVMNLKEVQNLQIYGFDAENNTFTSLQGLRFKWFITPIQDKQYKKSNNGVIQKIPLAESALYMPLDTRKKIQQNLGEQSDLLVIRALHVGKVSVKVRCLQSNYQMISDQITLYIQQKFEIEPGLPIHLLAGSQYQYHLLTPSGLNISLPLPHYKIQVTNPAFTISQKLLLKAPRRQSQSIIKVSDTRTQPPFSREIQVFSHQPDSIQISIPQQIIIGEQVPYEIHYYYKGKILSGEADPILTDIMIQKDLGQDAAKSDKTFTIDRLHHNVKSYHKGSGVFKVQFNGLSAQKKIQAVTPLKLLTPSINNKRIILPIGEVYQLSVIGGSSHYKYKLLKPSQSNTNAQSQQILTVSSGGLITTRKQGLNIIEITDQKNANNKLLIKVYVIKMGSIFSFQEHKQLNIQQQASLFIGARPRSWTESAFSATKIQGQYYTQCNDALLRGLSLTPLLLNSNSQSTNTPLQILNINPVNPTTLHQLTALSLDNTLINQALTQKSRTLIIRQQLLKQYKLHIQSNDIRVSELQRLITEMENYGLCAKVLVRGVSTFDGTLGIGLKGKQIQSTYDNADSLNKNNVKLRVYNKMQTILPIPALRQNQLLLTPLSTFRWRTRGGPYKWPAQDVKNSELQVYINDIKLDRSKIKVDKNNKQQLTIQQLYTYPQITCPANRQSSASYVLKYKNSQSRQLLRPTDQSIQINIKCQSPDDILVKIPFYADTINNKDKLQNQLPYKQFISHRTNSTVYLHAGQCFRIALLPTVFDKNNKVNRKYYYNASNIHYVYKTSIPSSKIEELPISADADNTQLAQRNIRYIKYDTSHRKTADMYKDDTITIYAEQLYNPSTKEVLSLHSLQHIINIRTLYSIKFSQDTPSTIELPNLASSEYTLPLLNVGQDNNRFSVYCNDQYIQCRKQGNSIIITPQNVQKSGQAELRVVDQYTLGRPQIKLKVKVNAISGIDLKVSRNSHLQTTGLDNKNNINRKTIDKNSLSSQTWIFNGDQFVVYVDVYTTNTSRTSGISSKQSITQLNPNTISINFNRVQGYAVPQQIYRYYDNASQLVVIGYRLGKSTRNDQDGAVQMLTASLKQSKSSSALTSNTGTIHIYPLVRLTGTSEILLPYQQLQISTKTKTKTLTRKIDTYSHIMQACSTLIQIYGGPPNLKSKVLVSHTNGLGTYYNVIKISERRYKIEGILSTQPLDKHKKDGIIYIGGTEKSLLNVLVYADVHENDNIQQLVTIRNLIVVAPITNVHILGNQYILLNRQVRYLVQFGKQDKNSNQHEYGSSSIIKQQCKFKYKWSVNAPRSSSKIVPLVIISDAQKMGINVTTNRRLSQIVSQNQQRQGVQVSPNNRQANIGVSVYNQYNRQVGTASKLVNIAYEQHTNLLPNTITDNSKENKNKILVDSQNMLLIPPNSAVKLNPNVVIQQVSPCDRQDTKITINGNNQISSGTSSIYPELVKVTHTSTNSNNKYKEQSLPTYTNIMVTNICTAAIQNTDGSISINPASSSSQQHNKQLIKFYLMDCYGRRFLLYNFKNVQYRVTSVDTNVATAAINDANNGYIQIQGNQLGYTQLILQVIANGVLVAKDVVPVYVNNFLQPAKPFTVHIGDVINFRAPASTNIGQQKWVSDNTNVVKINTKTGQAVASAEGQTFVKLGTMATKLSVIKYNDIKKIDNAMGITNDKDDASGSYVYQLIPNTNVKIYPPLPEQSQYVKRQLSYRCQVLGKQSQYLRAIAKELIPNSNSNSNKQFIKCKIQKIPGTSTAQNPLKTVKLRVVVENKNSGYSLSKEFQQNLQMFIILSDRYVNPIKYTKEHSNNIYTLTIQTPQRLDIYQSGGKDYWIVSNQFNGARQSVGFDLSQYRGGEWRINIVNPRTKQSDYIIINNIKVQEKVEREMPKEGWKWTDILVIFMAINFLGILGYQILQNNSGSGHSKVY